MLYRAATFPLRSISEARSRQAASNPLISIPAKALHYWSCGLTERTRLDCRIADDRYNYIAEVIPPAAREPGRLLLDEPFNRCPCAISGDISPTYRGFLTRCSQDGKAEFFETVDHVTVAEWEPIMLAIIVVVA